MNDSESLPAVFNSLLGKHFDFGKRESEIYQIWEDAKAFCYNPDSKKTFNISLPPPNANGELHIGHSYGYTVMDILARYARLQGKGCLLLPGKDHAGIQTQVVFEKRLESQGIDLKNLSKEELYKRCYEFCINRSQYMRAQEKTLGLSADWSRELFTLDPKLNKIVFETFLKLWEDRLVYRGKRLVYWSVFSQTSISDVEVEYREQPGKLWYILYPLVTASSKCIEITLPNLGKYIVGNHGIVVATTRPETILGDTALAVHPDDERYQHLVGKSVRVPLTGRSVKIIADPRIDREFGTGVVKVTPAHDFTDFEIGETHKLDIISIIDKFGIMTDAAGDAFKGLKSTHARQKIIEVFTKEGSLIDECSITHKVPIGERGKDVIEPLISEQWFLAIDAPGKSLKQAALSLLHSEKIKIYPERFTVLFEQWLTNLRDWNISRQLWWGHRLPVWYNNDGETYVGIEAPQGEEWRQESDVFDTWFSSGQWAYSTIAAHDQLNLPFDLSTPLHSKLYPNHTMVMGRDILFFWACRMLLLSAYRTQNAPWNNIFFTGLIRDEHGQKMSKSKGNGIEPNQVIEKHGADSLRLALVMGATPGNDISFGEKKIAGYSKFINKLWNAAKLIEMKSAASSIAASNLSLTNNFSLRSTKWITNKLAHLQKKVIELIGRYDISIASDELYNFFWSTYCDWYLEIVKIQLDADDVKNSEEIISVLKGSFKHLLQLLHPIVPFVTEEIYQKLPGMKENEKELLTSSTLAQIKEGQSEESLEDVIVIVSGIRSVKAALGIANSQSRVSLPEKDKLSQEELLLISKLARVEIVSQNAIPSEKQLNKLCLAYTVICEVENREQYKEKIKKDYANSINLIASLEKKLSGPFATQAKAEVVAKEKERLEITRKNIVEIREMLSGL